MIWVGLLFISKKVFCFESHKVTAFCTLCTYASMFLYLVGMEKKCFFLFLLLFWVLFSLDYLMNFLLLLIYLPHGNFLVSLFLVEGFFVCFFFFCYFGYFHRFSSCIVLLWSLMWLKRERDTNILNKTLKICQGSCVYCSLHMTVSSDKTHLIMKHG